MKYEHRSQAYIVTRTLCTTYVCLCRMASGYALGEEINIKCTE